MSQQMPISVRGMTHHVVVELSFFYEVSSTALGMHLTSLYRQVRPTSLELASSVDPYAGYLWQPD